MKHLHLLFGIKETDLEKTKNILSSILKIKLILHDSSYIGEYYRFGLPGEKEFILQYNFDDYEKEWTEDKFKDYPILLYVNSIPTSDSIEDLLLELKNINIEMLRQEVV